MISDYTFKMVVCVGAVPYTGYYIHNHRRRFKLVGVVRDGISTPRYFLAPIRRIISHMDNNLSYDALYTRSKRVKTYSVERCLTKDIQGEIDELIEGLFLDGV